MSNKNKNKKLEELSPEELQSRIKEDKKKAGRSVVLMFAAVIAIIVIGIAWFVANTRVSLTSGTISPADPNGFVLASVGSRQTAEQTYLKGNTDSNILNAGETEEHSEYIDVSTGQKVSTGQTTYHVGSSNLAWYLSSDHVSVSPGASGKMEFYIIPKVNGLQSVTVKLDVAAYQYSSRDSKTGNAKKAEDPTLQNLISGHILLFRSLDNDLGYSGWLDESGEFTVNAPENSGNRTESDNEAGAEGTAGTFKKDTPYKITLEWVWPKYFRNYVYYNKRNTAGDLFAEKTDDYEKLLKFVKGQVNLKESRLFYGTGDTSEWKVTEDMIGNTMKQDAYDLCTKYYNQADEYIGVNADFLYLEATVQ